MTIDFHSKDIRLTYSTRAADLTWINKINEICEIQGKTVLDVGCGGGIYSKAFANMGASSVTCVDFSEELLSSAKENCKDYSNIHFHLGNALDTKLGESQFDVLLERAVIHHITDLKSCFKEVYRLLKPGGTCIIQDRTPEDCLLEGSSSHIRGYFFEKYPHLGAKETSRRHSAERVMKLLHDEGFKEIKEYKLWETRKTYLQIEQLVEDLLKRTGRSILYELNNEQLDELVKYIKEKLDKVDNQNIVEKDRWTIWVAEKK